MGKGYYRKYFTQRLYGDDAAETTKLFLVREDGSVIEPPAQHADCPTFTLDPVHDFNARYTLEYYALQVAASNPDLAKDIRQMLNSTAEAAREAYNEKNKLPL